MVIKMICFGRVDEIGVRKICILIVVVYVNVFIGGGLLFWYGRVIVGCEWWCIFRWIVFM